MISIQVDFAKHSECVDRRDFETIKSEVTAYPDYLVSSSNSNKVVYESQHVLGKMYRHVEIIKFYEQCTKAEYF